MEKKPTVAEARRVVNATLNMVDTPATPANNTPADTAKEGQMEDEKDPKAEMPAEDSAATPETPEAPAAPADGQSATIEQIAEAAGVTVEQVQEFLEDNELAESMDALLMAVGQDDMMMKQLVNLIKGKYGKDSSYTETAEVM